MHRKSAAIPLAYFITIRTYGTWLHGDERGSVDAQHNGTGTPTAPPDALRVNFVQQHMKHEQMLLAVDSAALVENTVEEVCARCKWHLCIVKGRTNHLHAVVKAPLPPGRIMNDFKAWATRTLREHGFATEKQTVWVEHGSTRYLWTEERLLGAIDYVENWQGGPLQKTWDDVVREMDEGRQE